MHSFRTIFRLLVLLICTSCLTSNLTAQVTVKTTLDSSQLFIGQQSLLHLEVSGPANQLYQLPIFPGDTLVKGLEILNRSTIDTILTGNGLMELKMDFLLTSFDSGLYFIPPIPIVTGSDTFYSNYLGLKVMTYEVDTVKKAFFDIKTVQKPPFVFSDYLTAFATFLFGYLLILLLIWLYLRKKFRQDKEEQGQVDETLPPHVIAILELDRLKSDKKWILGRNKEFYTELTDILRRYMERRFQIFALEMTSEEILDMFRKDKTTQSVYQNLRQILQLSDLVKFAKIEPKSTENDLSIMNAYLFVNQTKMEEVKSIEEQKEALSNHSDEDMTAENSSSKSKDNADSFTKYMPK